MRPLLIAQHKCIHVLAVSIYCFEAVGGDAFGPASSVAVSEHGHGHHVVTQYLQGAQLLGESQCQLAGEASIDQIS